MQFAGVFLGAWVPKVVQEIYLLYRIDCDDLVTCVGLTDWTVLIPKKRDKLLVVVMVVALGTWLGFNTGKRCCPSLFRLTTKSSQNVGLVDGTVRQGQACDESRDERGGRKINLPRRASDWLANHVAGVPKNPEFQETLDLLPARAIASLKHRRWQPIAPSIRPRSRP